VTSVEEIVRRLEELAQRVVTVEEERDENRTLY
jgi:hypothetical protein